MSADRMTTRVLISPWAISLMAAILWVAGCQDRSGEPTAHTPTTAQGLARVGNRVLQPADLEQEAERRLAQRRPVPDKETLLQELATREALVQQARADGLDRDPEVRREIENLLVARLRQRTLDARLEAVTVSDDDLRAAYEARRDDYTREAKVRLAVLALPVSGRISEEKRAELTARLEEARAAVTSTPPPGGRGPAAGGFGALAVRYSDDQASRYRGGDIGWYSPGAASARFPAEVFETGFGLDIGAVSPVLETDRGFFVVMKTDAREASVTPFEQVQASLRQGLLLEHRRQIEDTFLEETRRRIGVEVDARALADLSLPAAETNLAGNLDMAPPRLPGGVEGTP